MGNVLAVTSTRGQARQWLQARHPAAASSKMVWQETVVRADLSWYEARLNFGDHVVTVAYQIQRHRILR